MTHYRDRMIAGEHQATPTGKTKSSTRKTSSSSAKPKGSPKK